MHNPYIRRSDARIRLAAGFAARFGGQKGFDHRLVALEQMFDPFAVILKTPGVVKPVHRPVERGVRAAQVGRRRSGGIRSGS